MCLRGLTLLKPVPLLFDCYLVHDRGTLIDNDVTDDWYLCVMQLWYMNIHLECGHQLFDNHVPDLWDGERSLNSDPLLSQFHVFDNWQVYVMLHGDGLQSVYGSFHG